MFEYRINFINYKFENVKEEVNNGKLLVYAKLEVEDLLDEAKELKNLTKFECEIQSIDILVNQLTQYLLDIESLIEKDCATTL